MALQENLRFVYFSELIGRPIRPGSGKKSLGRLYDLTASPEKIYPRITGLLVKKPFRAEPVFYPWSSVCWSGTDGSLTVRELAAGDHVAANPADSDILLKKSFLDRQLISTSGHKVVRVNDLHLLVEMSSAENFNLWLVHIDIGFKGLLRRLGWGRITNAIVRWILDRDMKDVFVSWKHVQTATATSISGSLRLTTDSSKLSEMHPADLADILEDLGAEERNRMVESLDPATAAATLAEMPLTLRVRVAESIRPEILTQIAHEMQTDNLVDLLNNLSAGQRTLLLSSFSPDMAAEIKELSRLSPASVGSIMNTDFLAAPPSTTVRAALQLIRANTDSTELIYYFYVTDPDDSLRGVVTLRHLLSADPEMLLADLMREDPITVTADTPIKRAARIFFKYDFDAIPVVDDDDRIRGIVTMRDALESVFPEVREESKG